VGAAFYQRRASRRNARSNDDLLIGDMLDDFYTNDAPANSATELSSNPTATAPALNQRPQRESRE